VAAAMRAISGVQQQHGQQRAALMQMVRMSQLSSRVTQPSVLPEQKSNAMMELNLILCVLKVPSVMEVREVDPNTVWYRRTTGGAGTTINRRTTPGQRASRAFPVPSQLVQHINRLHSSKGDSHF